MALTRVITFGDSSEDRTVFDLAYEGFVVGGILAGQLGAGKAAKPFDVVRTESRLVRKLKAISEVDVSRPKFPVTQAGEPHRTLLPGGPHTLTLSQPELDLLIKYCEATPWNPVQTDAVVNMVDALAAAEKRDGSGE